MGTFKFDKDEAIEGNQTLHPYFQGLAEVEPLMGGELEVMLFQHKADGSLHLPGDEANKQIFERMKRGPESILCSEEPGAHMFEMISNPHSAHELGFIANEIASHTATVGRVVADFSLESEEEGSISIDKNEIFISPFAIIPFADQEASLSNIISARGKGSYSDRPRIMMEGFAERIDGESLDYPVTNTAVHVTHGVTDRQHGFEMSRVLAAMMPFLFVLCENRPPYQNGSDERTKIHTGIKARQHLRSIFSTAIEQRGLFPSFLFTAENADDFFEKLIDRVMNQPLMSYLDNKGRFKKCPDNKKLTPANMQGMGPENVSQFALAMSQFWWSFKYKLLPGNGPSGMLHELRDFDSGPEVIQNVSLMMGMIALSPKRRAEMIRRLENDYGIPIMSAPGKAQAVIQQNMEAALHRGDPRYNPEAKDIFLLTPFGSTGKTMREFLRDTLFMMERHYAGTPAAKNLDNLRFTATYGITNAQFWNDCFDSVKDQNEAIRQLTSDPVLYREYYASQKSWPQMWFDGDLDVVLKPEHEELEYEPLRGLQLPSPKSRP